MESIFFHVSKSRSRPLSFHQFIAMECVQVNSSITKLDLSNNSIEAAGTAKLAKSLKVR